MTIPFRMLAACLCFASGCLYAQYDASEPGGGTRDHPSTGVHLLNKLPVTVKFMLEDGAPITATPAVFTGNEASMGAAHNCRVVGVFRHGSVGVIRLEEPSTLRPDVGLAVDPPLCFLRISLPGYQSVVVTTSSQTEKEIVLRRLGEHEGASVSLTDLSAPEDAKNAYAKGEALMPKREWSEAATYFEQAVALYPPYATAWSELGTALQEQDRFDDARRASQKAIAADPKYLKAWVQLAELDGRQAQWEDEVRDAQHAIDLHPGAYPSVYYYSAEGNYHLDRLPEAEHMCRTAIESDFSGEVPQAHFLLGKILVKMDQPVEARDEFRLYEQRQPHGPYSAEAKQEIRSLKSSR